MPVPVKNRLQDPSLSAPFLAQASTPWLPNSTQDTASACESTSACVSKSKPPHTLQAKQMPSASDDQRGVVRFDTATATINYVFNGPMTRSRGYGSMATDLKKCRIVNAEIMRLCDVHPAGCSMWKQVMPKIRARHDLHLLEDLQEQDESEVLQRIAAGLTPFPEPVLEPVPPEPVQKSCGDEDGKSEIDPTEGLQQQGESEVLQRLTAGRTPFPEPVPTPLPDPVHDSGDDEDSKSDSDPTETESAFTSPEEAHAPAIHATATAAAFGTPVKTKVESMSPRHNFSSPKRARPMMQSPRRMQGTMADAPAVKRETPPVKEEPMAVKMELEPDMSGLHNPVPPPPPTPQQKRGLKRRSEADQLVHQEDGVFMVKDPASGSHKKRHRRTTVWMLQCARFRVEKKLWTPGRPCCLPNFWLDEPEPPRTSEFQPCITRMSEEQLAEFRQFVRSAQTNKFKDGMPRENKKEWAEFSKPDLILDDIEPVPPNTPSGGGKGAAKPRFTEEDKAWIMEFWKHNCVSSRFWRRPGCVPLMSGGGGVRRLTPTGCFVPGSSVTTAAGQEGGQAAARPDEGGDDTDGSPVGHDDTKSQSRQNGDSVGAVGALHYKDGMAPTPAKSGETPSKEEATPVEADTDFTPCSEDEDEDGLPRTLGMTALDFLEAEDEMEPGEELPNEALEIPEFIGPWSLEGNPGSQRYSKKAANPVVRSLLKYVEVLSSSSPGKAAARTRLRWPQKEVQGEGLTALGAIGPLAEAIVDGIWTLDGECSTVQVNAVEDSDYDAMKSEDEDVVFEEDDLEHDLDEPCGIDSIGQASFMDKWLQVHAEEIELCPELAEDQADAEDGRVSSGSEADEESCRKPHRQALTTKRQAGFGGKPKADAEDGRVSSGSEADAEDGRVSSGSEADEDSCRKPRRQALQIQEKRMFPKATGGGICWDTKRQQWRVQIRIPGKETRVRQVFSCRGKPSDVVAARKKEAEEWMKQKRLEYGIVVG
eukprot:TRINITY_DN757_c0_g1_i3.p1 TRINITY_DN757_c0_g1~~TRINITY_DN757_c0_g1_i3.p1  ORF type:complete len:987 (-),score=203.71 TRINITY_DN757_c0_g1_i3:210-3170(-)